MSCKINLRYFLSLFMIISQVAKAQEHLEPVNGYLTSYNFQNESYSLKRVHLLDGYDDNPLARVFVLASFSPEKVISVDKVKDTYVLSTRTFTRQLETIKQNKNAKVERIESKKEIDKKLAILLGEIFFRVINETKYPKVEYRIINGKEARLVGRLGFDGETYIFSTFQNGFGIRAGQIWSPDSGTAMAELVAFSVEMEQVATGAKSESELLEIAEKYYAKVKK